MERGATAAPDFLLAPSCLSYKNTPTRRRYAHQTIIFGEQLPHLRTRISAHTLACQALRGTAGRRPHIKSSHRSSSAYGSSFSDAS